MAAAAQRVPAARADDRNQHGVLLIPLDRKLDWRRPPAATLGLALVTVLVFLLFQTGEDQRHRIAMDFYEQSGLMALELDRYQQDLRHRDPEHWLVDARADDVGPTAVHWSIVRDEDFAHRLLAGQVITADDPAFIDWRADRHTLRSHMDGITFWRFGLKPGDFQAETLLTHVFLHGDVFHLLGNLVFLIALGMLVELTIGWHRMLAAYLLGGVLVGAADLLFTPGRLIPGVGASGAIAVLMGLYAVLFGLQKVRFFYFVGVYFNYTRAPALLLLPLWLGWELLNWLWLSTDSSTHYGAHAVGLVVGALFGAGLRLAWPTAINQDFLREADAVAERERDTALIEQRLRELDYAGALPLLENQYARQPGNLAVLHRIHRCLRLQPDSARYHQVSQQLLDWTARHRDDEQVVLEVYQDYRRRAKPKPRLTGRQIQALAMRFARLDARAEAEELGRLVTDKRLPQAATVRVALAEMHLRAGHPERAQPQLQALLEEYPTSQEAEYGRGLLRRMHVSRSPVAPSGAQVGG